MDKKALILIFEVTLIVLLSLFMSSSAPVLFGKLNVIDEGQFSSWAYQMLQGKLPYKDIYITYGPLIIYPLYLLFKFFGSSLLLLKLYLVLGALAGSLASLFILRNLKVRFPFRLLAIVSISVFSLAGFRHLGALLALFLSYKAFYSNSHFLQFLVGIVVSLTYLISPDIGIFTLAIITVFLIIQFIFMKNIGPSFSMLLFSILGCSAVLICFYGFASRGGWFHEYLNVTLDLFISYSGQNVPNGKDFPRIDFLFAEENVLKILAGRLSLLYWEIIIYLSFLFFLLYKIVVRDWRREFTFIFLLTLFGISLYSILLTRYGHFYFTLLPLVIISAYFLDTMTRNFFKRKKNEKIVLGFFLLILIIFYIRLFQMFRFEIAEKISFIVSKEKTSFREVEGYKVLDKNLFARISLTREIVEENTEPNDYVFFLSDQPIYYQITKRQNPSRFDLPFIAGSYEKRIELLSDLNLKRPKIIIFDTKAWPVDEIDNKKRIPEVMEFIKRNYRLSQVEDGIEVYMTL